MAVVAKITKQKRCNNENLGEFILVNTWYNQGNSTSYTAPASQQLSTTSAEVSAGFDDDVPKEITLE